MAKVTGEDQRELAKKIILEIVHASGGTFDGATRLYKAFLFAHLYYFDDSCKILSNWPIVHMPHGHGIDDGDALIEELVAEGRLAVFHTQNGPYKEVRYVLQGEWQTDLPQDASQAIERTARCIEGKTGTELSRLIHDHSPSYNSGRSGEELDIYIDAIADDEYVREESRIRTIARSVLEVFRD